MNQRLQEFIGKAKRIAVLTGAGMSTESGLPDYRSSDGLYNTLTSEEVFDLDMFQRKPQRFYSVIGPLYTAITTAQPNAGQLALRQLERQGVRVDIATQNIDGLHQKAGSEHVYELHGTMSHLTCQRCGKKYGVQEFVERIPNGEVLHCSCGGVLKPDIVFYGEMLPEEAFRNAIEAFEKADLVLVLGTSCQVYPAASLPSYRRAGVPMVIINMTATSLDGQAALVLHDKIGEALSME